MARWVVCGDALAAVAVSGAAFAQAHNQATISGTIATASDRVTGAATNNHISSLDLRIGVSEDLGGGMRVAGSVALDLARDRATQANVGDKSMSLSGGFGSVAFTANRSGNLAMNGRAYAADMPTAAVNVAGIMSNVGVRGEVETISFTSPAFNGLRFNVARSQALGAIVSDARASTAGGTVNTMGLTYSAGALTAGFAVKNNAKTLTDGADALAVAGTVDGKALTATNLAGTTFTFVDHATGGTAGANNAANRIAAVQAKTNAALGGAAEKRVMEFNVAYDLGVARIAYGYGGKLTANGKALSVMGVSAPLANNITVGFNSGSRGDVKFQELGATYALSKRTSLQFATGSVTPRGKVTTSGDIVLDNTGTTSAINDLTFTAAPGAKVNHSRIRLVHTF